MSMFRCVIIKSLVATVYQYLCCRHYQVTTGDSVAVLVLVSSSSQITSGNSVSMFMLVSLSSH